jgi:hypothetical protein
VEDIITPQVVYIANDSVITDNPISEDNVDNAVSDDNVDPIVLHQLHDPIEDRCHGFSALNANNGNADQRKASPKSFNETLFDEVSTCSVHPSNKDEITRDSE